MERVCLILRSPFLLVSLLLLVILTNHDVAASTATSPLSTNTPSHSTIHNDTLNETFFGKFETHGPMLTLTLRDPSATALIGSSVHNRNPKSNLKTKLQQYRDSQRRMQVDDGTFGISSKLAALFHITPTTAAINGQSTVMASKQFVDGFMIDDGEILLGPPSETAKEGSTTGSLFPLSGLVDSFCKWSKNWSDCNVEPEMRYEMRTRQSSNTFSSLPWLSSASCGVSWRPFSTHRVGKDNGINGPHYLHCGASLAIPRVSYLWRSVTSNKQARRKTRDLDVGVIYRNNISSAGYHTPTVELLLGRMRPSLPPPNFHGSTARIKSILQSDRYRRNNHLMVRFGDDSEKSSKSSSKLASVEYVRGSLRLSTPSFLRRFRNNRGKGVTVMPSYDFKEGKARCVLSGDVGTTGRTRAVLRLDVDDSTLTLVRALDGNKIIAPTISLQSGKIVYDYHLDLDSEFSRSSGRKVGSSIRAHVDPSMGVILKWTDGVRSGEGSCWVTECRMPLAISAAGPLAADVRVGRRWVV